jgi:hypothetical protein
MDKDKGCQWCDLLTGVPRAAYIVEYTTAHGNREAWHVCASCLAEVQDLYACDETAHMVTWSLVGAA